MFGRYGKPVLMSEFGAAGKRGAAEEERALPNEAYYVDRLEWLLRAIGSNKHVRGGTVWCMFDYRTPLHWEAFADQSYTTRMGLCDEQYTPKLAFSVMQSFIHKRFMRRNTAY